MLTVLVAMGVGGWGGRASAGAVLRRAAAVQLFQRQRVSHGRSVLGHCGRGDGGRLCLQQYGTQWPGSRLSAIAAATNAIYLGARTAAGTGATAQSAIGIGTDVTASGSAVASVLASRPSLAAMSTAPSAPWRKPPATTALQSARTQAPRRRAWWRWAAEPSVQQPVV